MGRRPASVISAIDIFTPYSLVWSRTYPGLHHLCVAFDYSDHVPVHPVHIEPLLRQTM